MAGHAFSPFSIAAILDRYSTIVREQQGFSEQQQQRLFSDGQITAKALHVSSMKRLAAETTISAAKQRKRCSFSHSQVAQLEKEFKQHRYLSSEQRLKLSTALNLTEQQIKIWFQNRRYKTKRKLQLQAEMQKAATAAMAPASIHTFDPIAISSRSFVTVSQQPLIRQVPIVVLVENGKRRNFDVLKPHLATTDDAIK